MVILRYWSQYKADLDQTKVGDLESNITAAFPKLGLSESARSQSHTQLSKKGALVKKAVIDLYYYYIT